jgi:hypothetical protein
VSDLKDAALTQQPVGEHARSTRPRGALAS